MWVYIIGFRVKWGGYVMMGLGSFEGLRSNGCVYINEE